MPVTKGTKSGDDAGKSNETRGSEICPPVEKSSGERIPEQKEDTEIKERLPQGDTSTPKGEIYSPSPEQRECEERGDIAGVAESKLPKDSGTTRSEVSITSIVTSSEPHQTERTAGIKHQNSSGDGINSPDVTMSSLSEDTLSEQDEELESQINQASELQCRSCNNRYTQTEEKPDSCSDKCPTCKSATVPPLIPQIPQPVGNPVKNQNNDNPLQDMMQQEEEPPSPPVVRVAVVASGMLPEHNPPPESNSPPEDKPLISTPPELEQLQIGGEGNINSGIDNPNPSRSLWQQTKRYFFALIASILVAIMFVLVWMFVIHPLVNPDHTSQSSDNRTRWEKTITGRWTPFGGYNERPRE